MQGWHSGNLLLSFRPLTLVPGFPFTPITLLFCFWHEYTDHIYVSCIYYNIFIGLHTESWCTIWPIQDLASLLCLGKKRFSIFIIANYSALGIDVVRLDWQDMDMSGRDISGILIQYPDTDGHIHDYMELVDSAHANGVSGSAIKIHRNVKHSLCHISSHMCKFIKHLCLLNWRRYQGCFCFLRFDGHFLGLFSLW